jgi:hypothetical protein
MTAMSHESLQPRRTFLLQMSAALAPAAAFGISLGIANAAGRKPPKTSAKTKTPKASDGGQSPTPQDSKPSGPVDPGKLTLAQFQPLVNQEFKLAGPNNRTVPLVLTSVKDLTRDKAKDPARPDDVRPDPFQLLFLAKEFDTLPDQIYRFSHPKLGTFDAFINEVRADDDPATVHYCAVFN